MTSRSLMLCGLFLAAVPAAAQGPTPIPPGLASAKPHEVVERVLNKRADLALSEPQVVQLTAWHELVADEPHRFKHDRTNKPQSTRHLPMIGRQTAFDSTAAILTPSQRSQLATLFAGMPAGLKDLKPHELIEQVLNQKTALGLSTLQVTQLTAWHESVADEPHRFKHDRTTKPQRTTHLPMIEREAAFDSTIALLTPAQGAQLATLFARAQ